MYWYISVQCIAQIYNSTGEQQLNNFIMFNEKNFGVFNEKVKTLASLLSPSTPVSSPISLISLNSCRVAAKKKSTIQQKLSYQLLSTQKHKNSGDIVRQLYQGRCKDMDVKGSQVSWEAFLKVYIHDNPLGDQGNHFSSTLNYSRLSLGPSCSATISKILKGQHKEQHKEEQEQHNTNNKSPNKQQTHHITALILSCSKLRPSTLFLNRVTSLTLMNCSLGNDMLEELFGKIKEIGILQKLCLSSPQVNGRNVLTTYDGLISLVKSIKLTVLELSNVGIYPESKLLQKCRGTSLQQVDLSHNNGVVGINFNLTRLDLSHNDILAPFPLPLPQTSLTHLFLSHNQISSYHLQSMLKSSSFPYLTFLDLSWMHLSGSLSAVQSFLEHSTSLKEIKLVSCELDGEGFVDVMLGVKGAKVLQVVDVSRNRVNSQKIAQAIGSAMQAGCFLKIKMINCQMRDSLGAIVFQSLHKNKKVQFLDLSSNFLGEKTSRVLCRSLQSCLTLFTINLSDNPINYKQQKQIDGYLSANRHWHRNQLKKQMNKLYSIQKQVENVMKEVNAQENRLRLKQKQVDQVEQKQRQARKNEISARKVTIMREIFELKRMEEVINKKIADLLQSQSGNPEESGNANKDPHGQASIQAK